MNYYFNTLLLVCCLYAFVAGGGPERLARLTEQQRICLRLVFAHMTSKEIARELGISPDGVTQRINAAMGILGVDRRRDAALMLAEAEGLTAYPRRVYPPRDIASPPQQAMYAPSTEGGRQYGATSVGAMREEQTAFEVAPLLRSRGSQLPLPIWGGKPSDLSSLQRLGWVFSIMLIVAFMFGVFLAGLEALSNLGRLIAS